MNLGTQKWKKARANFAGVRDDAGRCGVACPRACCQGQGMQQPRQPPWAGSQGQGMAPWASRQPRPRHGPMGKQPRPRQAAKAKACLRACCHGLGHGSPHGQAAKAKARSQGLGMLAWARWHALGTPTRPWQHLGGLLLPSLDSLFGHLQLFPP